MPELDDLDAFRRAVASGTVTIEWSCDLCGHATGAVMLIPTGAARQDILELVELDAEATLHQMREQLIMTVGWAVSDAPDGSQSLACPECLVREVIL